MTAQVISNTLDKSGLQDATLPSGLGAGATTHKVLTDGVMFYCNHPDAPECPYSAPKYYQVFGHLAIHGGGRPGVRGSIVARKRAKAAGKITVDDRLVVLQAKAFALAEEIEAMRGVVNGISDPKADEWKARARKAEHSLKVLRQAIAGV